MTNTYALNVTKGQEFLTAKELRGIGLKPWVPLSRRNRFVKQKGAAGEYVWYDVPYINKLIFCVIPAICWPEVVKLKHVIGKPRILTSRDIEGEPTAPIPRIGLAQFRQNVERAYAEKQRLEAASQYKCEYTPGQTLKALYGPFEGFSGSFLRADMRTGDTYPRLEVEMQAFGQAIKVRMEPDQVRAN